MALPPKISSRAPETPQKKKEKVDDTKLDTLAFIAVSAFPIGLVSIMVYVTSTLLETFF